MANDRPNFVLFMPDQLRAESVGCYGHPVVQTPHFDRLAEQGTRFEQCHTTTPLCTPARCAMLTGWYPWTAGHRSLFHLLRPDEPSLFKTLRNNGYQVACFGKNDVFTPGHIEQALDLFGQGRGPCHGELPAVGDPLRHTFLAKPCPGAPDATADMRSIQMGLRFINQWQPGDAPFFLFLPLTLPHPPYAAPQPWHGRYLNAELPPLRPPLDPPEPAWSSAVRQARGFDALDPDVFRRIQATYLGMVEYTDWMLGQLLDTLDTSAAASRTVLMAASDHGDFAGDYGMVEKWHNCLLDVMTRVPLILRGPGIPEGQCITQPASLIDLPATTLALADTPAEHSSFSRNLFADDAVGEIEGPAVFSDGGFPIDQPQAFEGYFADRPAQPDSLYHTQSRLHQDHPRSVCRAMSIRTTIHRYVHRPSDVDELYDLRTDPHETRNLIDTPNTQSDRDRLHHRLMQHIAHTSDITPHAAAPRGWPETRSSQTVLPTAHAVN